MLKRRIFGSLAIASLVIVAACPERERTDVQVTDTIVPPPTAPPVTTPAPGVMPADTLMRDTLGMRDTLPRDTPRRP